MASADRNAALRALLVEQVDATRPVARTTAAPRRGEPGRFQLGIVSAAVAVLVVAASAAAISLSRDPGATPAGRSGAITTATPTAAPSAAPTEAPGPTSTALPTHELITPTGWHLLTHAQLDAYVQQNPSLFQDPVKSTIWEQEAWTDLQCMAEHGFVYDPTADHTGGIVPPGLTAAQGAEYVTTYYGPQTDAPYDWRTAGCHGLAVHLAGQDNAH